MNEYDSEIAHLGNGVNHLRTKAFRPIGNSPSTGLMLLVWAVAAPTESSAPLSPEINDGVRAGYDLGEFVGCGVDDELGFLTHKFTHLP